MDVLEFIEATDAEICCNKATVIQGMNRTVVAVVGDDGFEYTEEGKKLSAAYEAVSDQKATTRKSRSKKTEV